ncbi:MAG TPA: phosphopyruvate hydratase, partial [Bryobacteraceae bacterium]|nr:phosphopyruvate hydratase [Bryobacteraceae bacterium]
GASTGRHEALELRDGDLSRYGGKGVTRAVAHINGEIGAAMSGRVAEDPAALDRDLLSLDGTANKQRLGANALLAVSCAVARALAASRHQPLWQTLAEAYAAPGAPAIPVPMVNILSGGWHADHNIEIQDFLVLPHGFGSFADALHAAVAVHAAARQVLAERGLSVTGVADEGGWGPRFRSNEEALEIISAAIERAGYRAGVDCSIAIDIAASHFYKEGTYSLGDARLSSEGMIDLLDRWCREYPVVSIEDGLDQDDWDGWGLLTAGLGSRAQLIGDDFFTTNPERVRRGIAAGSANAVLVKMNQIGTLLETFHVLRLASEAGWRAVVSARSGETEDSFLADLATASGAGQIKVGSITRSERLAKYNRLLELEAAGNLPFARVATSAG